MANSLAPAEHDRCHFSRLNLDVLKTICDMIIEDSVDGDIVKSFDGLSRTTHLLRELSLPALFRTVTIRGCWDKALKRLTEMQDLAAFSRYTRLIAPLYLVFHNLRLI